MAMQLAEPTVHIDNESVCVTRWSFAPGSETGWHRHERRYVVVPLTTGRLVLETREGRTDNLLTAGVPYYRASGAEHNVINDGDVDIAFLEIEIK